MSVAHINIGSNLGNRRALIETAVALIEERLGARARRAPVIESAPWGYASPNQFLNLGIAVATGDMEPLQLHGLLQRIQHSIDSSSHRDAAGGYRDRCIDIDLIAVGNAVVDVPELTLPHPRMHLREFVLRPIAMLDPLWTHPLLHLTAAQLLALLADNK